MAGDYYAESGLLHSKSLINYHQQDRETNLEKVDNMNSLILNIFLGRTNLQLALPNQSIYLIIGYQPSQ
jgi:hypothetical protein